MVKSEIAYMNYVDHMKDRGVNIKVFSIKESDSIQVQLPVSIDKQPACIQMYFWEDVDLITVQCGNVLNKETLTEAIAAIKSRRKLTPDDLNDILTQQIIAINECNNRFRPVKFALDIRAGVVYAKYDKILVNDDCSVELDKIINDMLMCVSKGRELIKELMKEDRWIISERYGQNNQ